MINSSNLLEKNKETYNRNYKLYRAKYCRETGLPMYNWRDYPQMIENGIYTRTRAKQEKVKINEEIPVGWYRLQHGYTPLFKAVVEEELE